MNDEKPDGKMQARVVGGLLFTLGVLFGLTYLWVRAATGGDTADATDTAAAVTSGSLLAIGLFLLIVGSDS